MIGRLPIWQYSSLPPIQQTLDGRAVNTKFRGYLVDEKGCSSAFDGSDFFFICSRFLRGEHVSESLSQSTAVRQAIDIPEGDLHRLFAGFLLGSSHARRYLSGF
jgi:hypothetical protein